MASHSYTVSTDELAAAIAEMVQDTIDEDEKVLHERVQEAAKTTVKQLKSSSPKKTGVYASSWIATVDDDDIGHMAVTVHNRKKPGLTHLLEKGHAKFIHGHPTGGRVAAHPHIEPAYEAGARVLRRGT
ncbi:HK97 gp10 family phage protein [Lancefieldella rimae]|uniref:HK97 gp10 family phage protein n=1 Tax=Lancefieldella rimae (strain ATCC 49626 / DSM 7090 / CCUG 31168 / NBRC 15546 / VPI D140H-11A) TaxID=553184 RepID=B9CLK0_LANR4|nr:HK97 gp10 family phage protein [Lancefieldella rimae]EEE17530.1 hypothetical protein ATORI0001_1176 [Lancefieldella rimae ATCC 49626]